MVEKTATVSDPTVDTDGSQSSPLRTDTLSIAPLKRSATFMGANLNLTFPEPSPVYENERVVRLWAPVDQSQVPLSWLLDARVDPSARSTLTTNPSALRVTCPEFSYTDGPMSKVTVYFDPFVLAAIPACCTIVLLLYDVYAQLVAAEASRSTAWTTFVPVAVQPGSVPNAFSLSEVLTWVPTPEDEL